MRTVEIALDDELIKKVNEVIKRLGVTMSAFTSDALHVALEYLEEKEKEAQHQEGYLKHPVKPSEFSDWEDEQIWLFNMSS